MGFATLMRMIRNGFLLLFLGLVLQGYSEHSFEKSATPRKVAEEKKEKSSAVFDLNIFSGEENRGRKEYSACQSSLVAKKRLNPVSPICRVAFLTAAHCVDDAFQSIEVVSVEKIEKSCLVNAIPGSYRASVFKENERKRGDSATLVFELFCDSIEDWDPLLLAPVNPENEVTQIDGEKFFLQKRKKAESYNAGGGRLIQAELRSKEGHNFEFEVPSPQGAAILGGDSGGPVFNEKGQLVCPLSGSSYEGKKEKGALIHSIPDGKNEGAVDPFTVVCDKRAISRLKKVLEEHGLGGHQPVINQEPNSEDKEPCYKPKAKPKSN
jgi:hypothetical protein